jgi:hypothetical protein
MSILKPPNVVELMSINDHNVRFRGLDLFGFSINNVLNFIMALTTMQGLRNLIFLSLQFVNVGLWIFQPLYYVELFFHEIAM